MGFVAFTTLGVCMRMTCRVYDRMSINMCLFHMFCFGHLPPPLPLLLSSPRFVPLHHSSNVCVRMRCMPRMLPYRCPSYQLIMPHLCDYICVPTGCSPQQYTLHNCKAGSCEMRVHVIYMQNVRRLNRSVTRAVRLKAMASQLAL